MQKTSAYLIGIVLLMACMQLASSADDNRNVTGNVTGYSNADATLNTSENASQSSAENAAQNASQDSVRHAKVLRAGFEKTRALNNLDVYANRSLHNLETAGQAKSVFNISQRVGNTSSFTANTSIYKPYYTVNEYTRTKANYEAPGNLASRPVYNISGYPVIKAASSMP
jgi:hypothetical protein